MGFLVPKTPTPPPAANAAAPPTQAPAGGSSTPGFASSASLISTSIQGLQTKATTQKTSLLGGTQT